MQKKAEDMKQDLIFSISEQLGIKRVSVDQVRACHGFQNITDDEAEEIVESIYLLSILTYKAIKK